MAPQDGESADPWTKSAREKFAKYAASPSVVPIELPSLTLLSTANPRANTLTLAKKPPREASGVCTETEEIEPCVRTTLSATSAIQYDGPWG